MLLFLLPFAVVFGVVALRNNNNHSRAAQRALPPAPPVPLPPAAAALAPPIQIQATMSGGPPSPFTVLCEIMLSNRMPPPFVVQCAIAEMRMHHRLDIVAELEKTFGTMLAQHAPPATGANAQPGGGAANGVAPPAPPTAGPGAPMNASTAASPATTNAANAVTPGEPLKIASPIDGIADEAWSKFATACAREVPTFNGAQHVGRYRHRKDRLAAIGFDAQSLVGSTDAQDDAFAQDAFENLRELVESGTLEQYANTTIALPKIDTHDGANVEMSVSGILGVAMCAGLEGCVAWLENENDRKKFPNTTMAFLRTNGAF